MKKRNIWLDGILGVVTGDALGCPVEFTPREELKAGLVDDMEGYGTFNLPEGSWTDDSSLTLALLDSIRQMKGIDLTDIMRRFALWLTEGEYTPFGKDFDVGSGTMASIIRYLKDRDVKTCGGTTDHDNGNGSLMRIMPTCLYCYQKVADGKGILLMFQEELSDCDVFYIVTRDYGPKQEEIQRAFGLREVIGLDYPSMEDTEVLIYHICGGFGFPWDFRSELERSGNSNRAEVSDAVALCAREQYVKLRQILSDALYHALTSEKSQMDLHDLIYGIEKCNYVVTDQDKPMNPQIIKEHAYHEAGHILAGEILHPGSVCFGSIIRRGETAGTEGFIHRIHDEDTREDSVVSLLASKAAVEMAIGNSVNVGCEEDIGRAMELIKRMVLYSGQYGLEYTELYDDFTKEAQESRRRIDDRIYSVAAQLYEKARNILCGHRSELDQLAEKLMKDGYVLRSEIRKICHSESGSENGTDSVIAG